MRPVSEIADTVPLQLLTDTPAAASINSSPDATAISASPAQGWGREISRPRIVFINRYFFPDVSATSQILFDLALRLVELGAEVHVVCSRQLYDDPSAHLAAEESIQGIRVHRIRTSRFGRDRLIGRALDYGSFYVTGAAKLLALVRAGDVLVAKTDPPLISIPAALIARLRGARLINWLQDVFPEVASHLDANPLPLWLNGILKRLRDRSLRSAAMNVVLGGRMRELLERRGIPGSQIRVIENWADGDAVQPRGVESSELRKRLDLGGKFVVGYSGNLGRAHEFTTMLAAAEQLRFDERIVFLMIGGGARMQQLRRAAEEKGLMNFRFLPYQPRQALADSLAAANVHLACLLPELEGLIVPSKFYGILAAGRPAIFIGDTDGELARIIKESGCGVAVQTGDRESLVRAIESLMREPGLGQVMGARGRSLFVRKYTATRATEQWRVTLSEIGFDFAVDAQQRICGR